MKIGDTVLVVSGSKKRIFRTIDPQPGRHKGVYTLPRDGRPLTQKTPKEVFTLAGSSRQPSRNDEKKEISNVERKRKPINVHGEIKAAKYLDKTVKIRANTQKSSNAQGCTHPERERRVIQPLANKTDGLRSPKNTKKLGGVTGLGKAGINLADKERVSNKHVVATLHSTNHTDTNTQDQSTINNTNLILLPSPEDDLPFLTKESSLMPDIGSAFCDRLSLTFDMPNNDLEGVVYIARDLAEPTGGNYSFRQRKQIGQELYNHSYKLVSKNGEQVALFQFGPINSKAKFARLEMNPHAIGTSGIEQVRLILKALAGPSYRDCLADGNLTHFDATVDVLKIRPDDVMIFSDRARISSLWQRGFNADGREEWATETLSLGSPTSDYFVMAYDKAAQIWRVKGKCLDDLHMRIEAGINPRSKGTSHPMRNIMQIKNPFAPINIAYYPSPTDDDPWFYYFICAVRQIGAEEALRKIKDRNKRALYRQKLLEHEPDWWQPELMWAQFLSDLKNTNLFPDEIFMPR